MSRTPSSGAAVPRIGAIGKGKPPSVRTPARPSPGSGRGPGGGWGWVRGKLLYPAVLAVVSFASRLVGRGDDGLR